MPSGWIEENYPNKWHFTVVDIIKSGDLSTFDNTEIDSIQNLKQSLSKDQWDNLKLLFLDYSKHVEIAKRQNEEAIAVAAAKKREEQKAAISAREFVWREKLRIKEARMGFDSFTYEDKKEQDIKCQKAYQRYWKHEGKVITRLESQQYVMTTAKSKPSKPDENARKVYYMDEEQKDPNQTTSHRKPRKKSIYLK
jgi:hypothetical protein